MPWKGRSVMDERMRFVIRLKDGESMAALCREFGISRKTSHRSATFSKRPCELRN
jgi:putative transposase